ncbi:hypothetical protein ABTY61_36715 [Kitasatospora sp. NPDC096128]|uniref:hypothetical protein n=1 Tax=Kitasatospora sp. NPDC096128 TaxID=3155547 RepID=UPI00331662E4
MTAEQRRQAAAVLDDLTTVLALGRVRLPTLEVDWDTGHMTCEYLLRLTARHLHAQTGIILRLTHAVALDYTPSDRYLERFSLVFDGGTVRDTTALAVPPHKRSRLLGARFVPVRELPLHMAPSQAARTAEALTGRALPLLLHGRRPD